MIRSLHVKSNSPSNPNSLKNNFGGMSGCGGDGHGHGHDHGGHGSCGDGHDHPPAELGVAYSLYTRIDTANVECLNEAVDGSGKTVFKPWEDRLSRDKFVESDADEELLFNIPFTDNIKLKGIIIVGGENGHHPNKMRLYKNKPHMTFDDVGLEADQEFELHPDPSGTLEYTTKVVKFSSVTHLSIHFPSNFGEDTTKISYIGFRGEYTKAHRHRVTICNYEMSPQLSDHKDKAMDAVEAECLMLFEKNAMKTSTLFSLGNINYHHTDSLFIECHPNLG